MNKIRVTHIINNLEIGGAERLLLTLTSKQAVTPGLEIEVISLEGHGLLEKEFLKVGVKVTNFNFTLFHRGVFGKVSKFFDIYYKPELFRYLRQNKPDILHGHLLIGEDYAKVAGILLNIPVICTVHDVLYKQGFKQRLLNKFLAIVVAVSPEVKRHVVNNYCVKSEKIEVIPNAIDFANFVGCKKVFNPKKPVFTYIGRITTSKGLEFAIEGLAQVQEQYHGLVFEIYGKGVEVNDEERLKQFISEKKWNFVKFMGLTNDVPKALSKCDVFVLPSQSEGFSLAVLEAVAASKPIIATKVGITEKVVNNEKTGYLVEYGSGSQIAEAGLKILRGDVGKMGEKSRNYNVERYSIEKTADLYYNLYLKVMHND